MANVCALFQRNSYTRKHVYRAVLLHIAAVFNYNFAPIAAQRAAGTNVYIFTNYHMTGNRSLRVNKRGGMHHRLNAIKLVKHGKKVKKYMLSFQKAFEVSGDGVASRGCRRDLGPRLMR